MDTITASAAKLDARIYSTVAFVFDERYADKVYILERMPKNHEEALLKDLIFTIQQSLQSIRTILLRVNDAELLTTMTVAGMDGEGCNNTVQECKKVDYLQSTNCDYVVVTAK